MVTREEEPLKKQHEDVAAKKSLKEKILYIKDNITIEPLLITYIMTCIIGKLATQNLYLDKVCRVNLKYGDQVCDALIAKEGTMYQQEELTTQELVASMEAWKSFILTAIPSLLILFIGSWSDRTGNRKICILLPIAGELLTCLSNIVNVYYFKELPVQVAMFFEAFFPAITGGWSTIYMGSFSYVSETSSKENRTFRVGLANLCLTAGGPIGTAISGVLLKYTGYYGVFTICGFLFCSSIGLGLIFIKHPENPTTTKEKEKIWFDIYSPGIASTGMSSNSAFIILTMSPYMGSMQWLLSAPAADATLKAAMPNVKIYVSRVNPKTSKGDVMQYIADTYEDRYGTSAEGRPTVEVQMKLEELKSSAVLSISLFSKKWQWGDPMIGLISSVSKIIGAMVIGLSRNASDMYIASFVEMFNGTSFTALRSMSTKLVSSDELGKMISVFNLTEILTSMVFGPLYSWIYMVSLKIDAGVVYYFSTALTVPSVFIYIWFFMQDKKETDKNKIEIKSDTEKDIQKFEPKDEPIDE